MNTLERPPAVLSHLWRSKGQWWIHSKMEDEQGDRLEDWKVKGTSGLMAFHKE